MTDGGTIKLYKVQKEMIEKIFNNRFSVNMTARQSGGTLMINLLILHSLILKYNKPITLFSNMLDDGKAKIEKIKELYLELPFFMKCGISRWNEISISNDNGTKLRLHSTTKPIYTLSEVYLDNFAYIRNQDDMLFWLYPEISATEDSKLIINSCPNGYNKFLKIFHAAEDGKNGFIPNRIYWDDIPGRDKDWKNLKISEIGIDAFDEEYDLKVAKIK